MALMLTTFQELTLTFHPSSDEAVIWLALAEQIFGAIVVIVFMWRFPHELGLWLSVWLVLWSVASVLATARGGIGDLASEEGLAAAFALATVIATRHRRTAMCAAIVALMGTLIGFGVSIYMALWSRGIP
jgi:hypothetical protein